MFDLTGRVALVTGSSRGIGRACALRLAEAGAHVVINYIASESAARQVAGEIRALGRRALVVKADVSEREDVAAMMGFIGEQFGCLDILVSNAASGGFRPLATTTEAQFQAAMNTNVRALLWLVQSGAAWMKRSPHRAKVIALSSEGSHLAVPLYGLVGASKAALESMMRHFALECGGEINFNTIQAGFTETDATRSLMQVWQANAGPNAAIDIKPRIQPSDIASVVLFLASSLSDKIQGQTLLVDGGGATERLVGNYSALMEGRS